MSNQELDRDYIKSKIQEILNKAHPESQKKYIKDNPDYLNFSCPICGDSQKQMNKKRGYLYFKNMMYICFNESECNRSFIKLLKTFNIDIDLQKKLDIYNYVDTHVTFKKDDDIVWNKECGNAGYIGCNDNDQTIGLVYDKTIEIDNLLY